MPLMCSCVTASTAGYKEHTWQSLFQWQGQSSATGFCSSSCVCLCHLGGLSSESTRGQRTAPASPVVLQEMNLPVLLPTSVLFRASPASCWELNKGLIEVHFMRGHEICPSFFGLGATESLFMPSEWDVRGSRGGGKRLQADFSLLESNSHSCCLRGEWFTPPAHDLFSNAK